MSINSPIDSREDSDEQLYLKVGSSRILESKWLQTNIDSAEEIQKTTVMSPKIKSNTITIEAPNIESAVSNHQRTIKQLLARKSAMVKLRQQDARSSNSSDTSLQANLHSIDAISKIEIPDPAEALTPDLYNLKRKGNRMRKLTVSKSRLDRKSGPKIRLISEEEKSNEYEFETATSIENKFAPKLIPKHSHRKMKPIQVQLLHGNAASTFGGNSKHNLSQ